MEKWKDIDGYEGLYKISNFGRVLSAPRQGSYRTPRCLTIKLDTHGYQIVDLFKNGKGSRKKVHRLVAQAFIPNPYDKKTVNHKDGNPKNNHVDNLEWATQRENNLHCINVLRNRFKPVASYNKSGNLVKQYESVTEAAKDVGAQKTNIVKACRGQIKSCAGLIWQYL